MSKIIALDHELKDEEINPESSNEEVYEISDEHFESWRKELRKKLRPEYKKMTTIIDTNEMYEIEPPEKPSIESDEILTDTYEIKYKLYKRAVQKLNDKQKSFYTAIISSISDNAIKRLKKDQSFNQISIDADPTKLWKLIIKTFSNKQNPLNLEIELDSPDKKYREVKQDEDNRTEYAMTSIKSSASPATTEASHENNKRQGTAKNTIKDIYTQLIEWDEEIQKNDRRVVMLKSRPPPTVAAIVFPTTGDGEEWVKPKKKKSNTNNKRVEKSINQNVIMKKHIKGILYNYNIYIYDLRISVYRCVAICTASTNSPYFLLLFPIIYF